MDTKSTRSSVSESQINSDINKTTIGNRIHDIIKHWDKYVYTFCIFYITLTEVIMIINRKNITR